MNKSSLLLVTTILLGLIGQSMSAQWTRGYEASIYWGSGNRLQNSRETPRNSGVYQVNFGFKMRDIPQVMLNPNIYDWQNGMPTNWELTIEEITTEYFKYKITTTSPRELYTIFFNWIAVVGEESLQVKYIKLKTNELAKSPANGDQVTESFKISFDFLFDDVPTVWTSMVGQSFIGGKYWDINQEPVDIDKAGFTLEISSEYSKIEWVSFAIWATDASISYTIDKNFELDCDDTKAKGVIGKLKGRWAKKKCIKHNKDLKRWVQRNPSEAFEYEDYQVTEEFRKKGSLPQPVSGMQGFRVDADRNMRLQCQRDEYDTKNAIQKVRMGTWWDTQLYRITYFQLIFVISPDKCVKLYSECNFQGEELASICETTPAPALAAQYHGQNVKSIKVPKGVVITLYEKENYQGKSKEFVKDESCIKGDWTW